MNTSGNTWAIVLAAGEGSRLHSLTTTEAGIAMPKQYCSLRGGRSLLREALQRAETIASPANRCIVVAPHHKHWWDAELAAEPESNVIVQPSNRGTANGILLPLLHIMARDPDARIVLLPSDHHVSDERLLSAALEEAVRKLEARRDQVLLLGISPEEADPDLGYIVPGRTESVHGRCAGRSHRSLPRFAGHRFLTSNPAKHRVSTASTTRKTLWLERSRNPATGREGTAPLAETRRCRGRWSA
jgi:mannose-1-phosphate guanylyltransferase